MAKYLKLFNNHEDYLNFKKTTDFILPNVSHCVQENEVHYDARPIHNGHAYVDLGLPSGTKWATMNVGANSPTDYGLYFAWGETQGYTVDQVGNGDGKKAFSWSDYKYETSSSNLTKYNSTDKKTHLELTDDAAAVSMGGDWHMPTKEQCEELFNTTYVTNEWVTDYQGSGVNGRLFTSVNNGNTMFIPAAGLCEGGRFLGGGNSGYVWASVLESGGVRSARAFLFNSARVGVSDYDRCYGYSVRGVVGQMNETTV